MGLTQVLGAGDYEKIGLAVAAAMDSSGGNLTPAEAQTAFTNSLVAQNLSQAQLQAAFTASLVAQSLSQALVQAAVEAALAAFATTHGFRRSAVAAANIASAATQSSIVDLGANYGFLTIRLTDGQRVQAGAKLRVFTSTTTSSTGSTMTKHYDMSLQSADLITLPNGSGLTAEITLAIMGVRRVQLEMSLSASGGDALFEVYGSDLMA